MPRPSLLDHQGPVQSAVAANDRDGRQLVEDGEPGLDRAELHDLVLEAKDARRPVPVSARRWAVEPVG